MADALDLPSIYRTPPRGARDTINSRGRSGIAVSGDALWLRPSKESIPTSHVYFWQRDDKLPKIPVPLKSPDPDVALDLAAVYKTAYDRGRHTKSIDYSQPIAEPT